MKRFTIIICTIIISISALAQSNDTLHITLEHLQAVDDYYEKLERITKDAYTPGITNYGDSIVFSDEYVKLLKDEAYRNSIFTQAYSFEGVLTSLSKLEMQKACWELINLYPEHKELVIKTLFAYSNHFQIEKVVIFSVYTYGFFDPEIAEISDGKPNVIRPDLLEEKLQIAKEIAAYIQYYKNLETDTTQAVTE